TGTTNDTRCDAGVVNLGASASAGTISWWDSPTGGLLQTAGPSYSPSIPSTKTYYVDATSTGCTTAARTAVTGTVNTTPTITGTTNDTRCDAGVVNLAASASAG